MGGRERTILLSGMMGSGKTTVGHRLAERLGWPFVDTDEVIASEAGMSIPEIFEREGESGFRARERAVLERLPACRTVVALGGGAVLSSENRELLRTKGTRVLLEADPQTLADRVGNGGERPLLGDGVGVGRIREILALRSEAYASAEVRIATDGVPVDGVCDALMDRLRLSEHR